MDILIKYANIKLSKLILCFRFVADIMSLPDNEVSYSTTVQCANTILKVIFNRLVNKGVGIFSTVFELVSWMLRKFCYLKFYSG